MQQIEDIEIELSEPQTAVLSARTSQILDMAGQGGGKSQLIGFSSGMFVTDFPRALGFIAANTSMQLSQSTLTRVFATWKDVYNYTEYDAKANPAGAFVIDKRPPYHFERLFKLRDYTGTISFYNGALIFIGSLENYKAHEGKEFAWAHLDETKDTKEAALKEVIMARLRQFGLWFQRSTGDVHFNDEITADEAEAAGLEAWNPLYIHTSPALGGVDWINKRFKLDAFEKEIKKEVLKEERGYFYKEFDGKTVVIYSTHHNAHNLPPNYIENQKNNLATEDAILKMVYAYPFGKSGGEYYPAFRRDYHVGAVSYIPGEPVHQAWDFNAVPYMTLLCAQILYLTRYIDAIGMKHDDPAPGCKPLEVMRIQFYKEYCLKSPQNSTEAVCEAFKLDHDPQTTEVYYYGDASGLHRVPGLGSWTNYKEIESLLFEYIHNFSKRVRDPNVGVLKRRDLLNKIFAGKIPEMEIIFDVEMVETIADFEHLKEGVSGKIKTQVKDPGTGKKYEDRGHTSDAGEYLVSEVGKPYLK